VGARCRQGMALAHPQHQEPCPCLLHVHLSPRRCSARVGSGCLQGARTWMPRSTRVQAQPRPASAIICTSSRTATCAQGRVASTGEEASFAPHPGQPPMRRARWQARARSQVHAASRGHSSTKCSIQGGTAAHSAASKGAQQHTVQPPRGHRSTKCSRCTLQSCSSSPFLLGHATPGQQPQHPAAFPPLTKIPRAAANAAAASAAAHLERQRPGGGKRRHLHRGRRVHRPLHRPHLLARHQAAWHARAQQPEGGAAGGGWGWRGG